MHNFWFWGNIWMLQCLVFLNIWRDILKKILAHLTIIESWAKTIVTNLGDSHGYAAATTACDGQWQLAFSLSLSTCVLARFLSASMRVISDGLYADRFGSVVGWRRLGLRLWVLVLVLDFKFGFGFGFWILGIGFCADLAPCVVFCQHFGWSQQLVSIRSKFIS